MIFANILGHTEMLGTKWGNNHVVIHVYEGSPFSTFYGIDWFSSV